MSADLFWQMNTEGGAADKAMGEKHAPIIDVDGACKAGEKVKVTVDVGGGKHPNENGHFIQWIELRVADLYVGRVDFAPVIMDPVATFTMIVPDRGEFTLSAVSRCNLHGLWESKMECKVG